MFMVPLGDIHVGGIIKTIKIVVAKLEIEQQAWFDF